MRAAVRDCVGKEVSYQEAHFKPQRGVIVYTGDDYLLVWKGEREPYLLGWDLAKLGGWLGTTQSRLLQQEYKWAWIVKPESMVEVEATPLPSPATTPTQATATTEDKIVSFDFDRYNGLKRD